MVSCGPECDQEPQENDKHDIIQFYILCHGAHIERHHNTTVLSRLPRDTYPVFLRWLQVLASSEPSSLGAGEGRRVHLCIQNTLPYPKYAFFNINIPLNMRTPLYVEGATQLWNGLRGIQVWAGGGGGKESPSPEVSVQPLHKSIIKQCTHKALWYVLSNLCCSLLFFFSYCNEGSFALKDR